MDDNDIRPEFFLPSLHPDRKCDIQVIIAIMIFKGLMTHILVEDKLPGILFSYSYSELYSYK